MCQWPEERITKILSKKHIKGTIVEKVVMYKIDRRGRVGKGIQRGSKNCILGWTQKSC